MKTRIFYPSGSRFRLAGLFLGCAAALGLTCLPVSAEVKKPNEKAATPAVETEEDDNYDPKPYGIDRYSKFMEKSPFDFPIAPPPPPPEIRSMEGWALAGLSRASDYIMVTLVNLKNPNERLRLTRYTNPTSPDENTKKIGQEVFVLLGLEFAKDGAELLKNATAVVSRNGRQDSVKYDEKVMQMKAPATATPLGRPGGGPMPPGMQQQQVLPPGVQPGQTGGPATGSNTNAALMNLLRNTTQPGSGGATPVNTAVPVPPQVNPAAQGTQPSSSHNEQVLQLMTPAGGAAGGQTQPNMNFNAQAGPGGQGGPSPRRRVVLPTPEPPQPGK